MNAIIHLHFPSYAGLTLFERLVRPHSRVLPSHDRATPHLTKQPKRNVAEVRYESKRRMTHERSEEGQTVLGDNELMAMLLVPRYVVVESSESPGKNIRSHLYWYYEVLEEAKKQGEGGGEALGP